MVPPGTYLVSQVTMTVAGVEFVGNGETSIIKGSDATKDLFLVRAANVRFADLRFEGPATSAANSKFAILTDVAYAAPRLTVENCTFSGAAAGSGFTNAVKFDEGCDYSTVSNCKIERLWGNASGYGYGVLMGKVTGCVIHGNRIIGSSGRGRHGIYVSSGATRNKVVNNHIAGIDYDAITVFAYESQSTCYGNIIGFNTISGCVIASTSGAISLARNVQNTLVIGNVIETSGGVGILCEGSAPPGDTASLVQLKNNHLHNNVIYNSSYWGIAIYGMQGGSVIGNDIYESSQTAAGSYSNIQVKCTTTASFKSSDIHFAGNRSTGTTNARSAFNADSTAPAPTGLVLKANYFPTCQTAALEVSGVTVIIDSVIRFSQTWDPASVANGASVQLTGITVTGAAVGDPVDVSFSNSLQGMSLTGYVTATDTVAVTLLNNTGGAVDLASGTLKIGVRKESY